MTDKAAIRELREKVEAGQWDEPRYNTARTIFGIDGWTHAIQAYDTNSLDAALALHEAVLPKYTAVSIESFSRMTRWSVTLERLVGEDREWVTGRNANLARAWLLAVLKAMEAEEL